MKFLLALYAAISILVACNNANNTTTKNEIKFPKEKFDAIEKIVGVSNWLVTGGMDTSYMYFSRTGDLHVNVYHYRMDKGDSTGTKMNNIDNTGDSAIWNYNDRKLVLSEAGENFLAWKDGDEPSEQYLLKKMDSLNLLFTLPGGKEIKLKKTLPLSVFLARKRYDYLHGTSYVDSPEVKSRELQ